MLDLAFWLDFLMLPFAVWLLLRMCGERLTRISIVSVTVVALYLFSVIGTMPLYYGLDPYRVATGIVDRALVFHVLFYSSVNLVCLLTGVLVTRRLTGWRPCAIRRADIRDLSHTETLGLTAVFIVCLAVLALYLSKIDGIALFEAIKGNAQQAEIARSQMGNAFPGKYHWYRLVMHDFGNLITFTVFISWLRHKTKMRLLLLLITLSYSIFVSIMATEKAPIAWLLVGLFMAYFLERREGRVPLSKALSLVAILLLVVGLTYIYFMDSQSLSDALSSVVSRAFSGSIAPAYFYLEYVPKYHDYYYGTTFPNFAGIFPYQPVRYTVDIMNWKFPELAAEGIVGSMPTVFWGESYLNFGPIAIPIVAFVMGSFLAVVSYVISKIELTPLSLGLLVWVILDLKNLANSGFSGFLPDFYMIGVGIVFLAVWCTNRRIRVRNRRVAASTP